MEDATGLLGTTSDWLIAGGARLYWISLKEEDRGRVKHVWPDGPERPGYGRGILAGQDVLWPTRDKLYIFNQQTARPRRRRRSGRARRLRRQSVGCSWKTVYCHRTRVDRAGDNRRKSGQSKLAKLTN